MVLEAQGREGAEDGNDGRYNVDYSEAGDEGGTGPCHWERTDVERIRSAVLIAVAGYHKGEVVGEGERRDSLMGALGQVANILELEVGLDMEEHRPSGILSQQARSLHR